MPQTAPAQARTCYRRHRGILALLAAPRQVGLAPARKTAEVRVEADTYLITVEPGITSSSSRTTSRDIKRRKRSNYSRES